MKLRFHHIPAILLSLAPLHVAHANVAEGEKLVREGRYAEAVTALAGEEDSPEVCFWRGRALIQLKRYVEASINLNKVPKDHVLFPYAAKGIILCAWKANDIHFVEAMAVSQLTTCDNKEISSLATAAMAEFQLRNTKEGDTNTLRELRRMAAEAPQLKPVLRLMEIENQRIQGSYEDAINAAKAMEEDKDLPQTMRLRARLSMAEIYYSKGEDATGEETLLQFIDANPDSPLLQEAFRRLVVHRAFVGNSYTAQRLKDWSEDVDKPHRAALALLMRQRVVMAEGGHEVELTNLASAASSLRDTPAAKIVILEQVRHLLQNGRYQEAGQCLAYLGDSEDPRVRFYAAVCKTFEGGETLQDFEECMVTVPSDLQPAAAANAMYAAVQKGGESADIERLLEMDLPKPVRIELLLMHATLMQAEDPSQALKSLEELGKYNLSVEQQAEAALIKYSILVLGSPQDTLQTLKKMESDGTADAWPNRLKRRFYKLQLEAQDNIPGNTKEAGIALARHIVDKVKDTGLSTEFTFNLAGRLSAAGLPKEAYDLLENAARNTDAPNEKAKALLLAAEQAAKLGSMEYFEKAMSLFEQCARLDTPYRAKAIVHRANVLMWINRADEAQQLLQELLADTEDISPNEQALAYTALVDTYSMQGTPQSRKLALKAAEEMMALPGLSQAWQARMRLQHAALCSRYGMHKEALGDYLAILEVNPDSPRPLGKAQWFILNYAGAGAVYEYLELGQRQEAADLAERLAYWLGLCPAGMIPKVENNRESFRRWAELIRCTF